MHVRAGRGTGRALPSRIAPKFAAATDRTPTANHTMDPALHMCCVSPALGAAVVQWTLRHTCATAHAITWSAMNNTEHMHHGPYPMQHGDGLDVAFGPYPTYRAVRCGVVAGSYRAGKSWYGMSRCVELVRCRVRTQRAHAVRTCAGTRRPVLLSQCSALLSQGKRAVTCAVCVTAHDAVRAVHALFARGEQYMYAVSTASTPARLTSSPPRS